MWLLTNPIARKLGTALAILLIFLGWRTNERRIGANEADERQKNVDHENAADIRNRLDAATDVRDDELKFRD